MTTKVYPVASGFQWRYSEGGMTSDAPIRGGWAPSRREAEIKASMAQQEAQDAD